MPNLEGGSAGDYCAVLLFDDIDVTVAVDGISLSATPAPVTVVRDDETGCAGQSEPLCAAGSIAPEGKCLVGVGLDGSPPGTYDVTVSLDLRVSCTAAEPVPCNQVGDPVPTPDQPVDAIWSDTGPELSVTVDEPPDPGGDPSAEPGGDPAADPGAEPSP